MLRTASDWLLTRLRRWRRLVLAAAGCSLGLWRRWRRRLLVLA